MKKLLLLLVCFIFGSPGFSGIPGAQYSTTAGVFKIGTLPVSCGGTATTTLTQYYVLVGAGAGLSLIAPSSTAGYPFCSNGSSANPIFQQLDLTVGVTNILPMANGGTNKNFAISSAPAGALIILGATGSGGNLTALSSVGTQYQVLNSQGSGSGPVMDAVHLDQSPAVTGVLPIANGGTDNGSLGVSAGGVVYTDGTKLQNTNAGTSAYPLLSAGASAPAFGQLNLAGVGITGTLPVANGGTGQTVNYNILAPVTQSSSFNAAIGNAYLVTLTTSNATVTLPTAVGCQGCTLSVTLIANTSGVLSWATTSSQHINTQAATVLPNLILPGTSYNFISDGAGWQTLAFGLGYTFINGVLIRDASGNLNWDSPLAIVRGGTGASSLSGYGAVVMNSAGTAQTVVAPGASANVLTSNGTSWTSAAPATGGAGFGGNGVDGAISNPTTQTLPFQQNATTWALTGANTYTLGTTNTVSGPAVLNATSTFTLGDASNASTITVAAGTGAAGGASVTGNTTNVSDGTTGSGPGGGTAGHGGTFDHGGGGGGGFGGGGGGGGNGTSGQAYNPGGQTYPAILLGGSGGGSGTVFDASTGDITGAAGNGGGSLIVCAVGAINCKTVSVINCKGGNGTAASLSAGGSGGGSGGLVLLASQVSVTVAGTINVSGGNGSNGAGADGFGGGGGGGGSGRIILWAPTITTTGSTFTMSGGTGGTAGSGSTNGASGSSGAQQSVTGTPNLPLLVWLNTSQGSNSLCLLEQLGIHNIHQRTLANFAGHNDITQVARFNMGNFHSSTCMGVGDFNAKINLS